MQTRIWQSLPTPNRVAMAQTLRILSDRGIPSSETPLAATAIRTAAKKSRQATPQILNRLV